MKKFIHMAAVLTLLGTGSAANAEIIPTPYSTLDGQEVISLYSDKTWPWSKGHAYFGPAGQFQATTGPQDSATGRWYATSNGKLCFAGEWTSGSTSTPSKRCWQHVRDSDGQLWQAPVGGTGQRSNWTRFDSAEMLIDGNPRKHLYMTASGQRERIVATRLAADDLARLYADRTWLWDEGYAYFAPGGGLTAAMGRESYGEGRWFTNAKGHLCINSTWHSPQYAPRSSTRCWLHARDAEGNIHQTDAEDMTAWYRFDPKAKLRHGNPNAQQFAAIKTRLSQ